MAQVNGNGNDPENFPELSEADRRLLLEQHIDIEGMMLMRHRGGNGGDSIAAVNKYSLAHKISYISTACISPTFNCQVVYICCLPLSQGT